MNKQKITNIMSVDLEDYYCDLKFEEWGKYDNRVQENTEKILALFEKYNVTATFFCLGYIAEKFPDLIMDIKKRGHEIASHSYAHIDLRKVSKEEFEKDLQKSINIIEKITGDKVKGFRAPFFSIDKNSFWAFEVLRKYVEYDSSIFPVKTHLYGVPNAPRHIYNPSKENPLKENKSEEMIEIPLATHKTPFIGNIPIAGGFYLRFFPYQYIKFGINKMNKKLLPAMIYIHPKDIDPNMPKIKEYSWHYYFNQKSAINKFEKLLKDFKFCSVEKYFGMARR
jgi:peptidoglycan-N-acetylglucosamine deacetylase